MIIFEGMIRINTGGKTYGMKQRKARIRRVYKFMATIYFVYKVVNATIKTTKGDMEMSLGYLANTNIIESHNHSKIIPRTNCTLLSFIWSVKGSILHKCMTKLPRSVH